MPLECSVCMRTDRAAIDAAIVAGNESLRTISDRWSVSKTTLLRHREHIPATLAIAKQAVEVTKADTLLEQVQSLQSRALNILDRADKADDLRVALGAIREVRGVLELLGKVSGELTNGPAVQVNIAVQTLIQTAIASGLTEEQVRTSLAETARWGEMTSSERIASYEAGIQAERTK